MFSTRTMRTLGQDGILKVRIARYTFPIRSLFSDTAFHWDASGAMNGRPALAELGSHWHIISTRRSDP
jgi:hypothetical protein